MKKYLFLLSVIFLTACGSGGKTAGDMMASTEAVELTPLREDDEHLISDETATKEAEEDSVGLMAFYPNGSGSLSALAGMNTFTFYFEHDDVEVNEGRIGLYDADATDDPLISAVDVTDSERVSMMPIDPDGINISNFDNGSMAVIRFDRQYEPGKRYYVLLDNGCFRRGNILSTGIANASYITFSVKPYGIKGGLKKEYGVGESTVLPVILGGDATAASMIDYNSQFLSFSPATFHESGDETVLFRKATTDLPASCSLAFFDKKGQKIDSCTFYFDIVDKPTDKGAHSVENNTVKASDIKGQESDGTGVTDDAEDTGNSGDSDGVNNSGGEGLAAGGSSYGSLD